MKTPAAALRIVLDHAKPIGFEQVHLGEAAGRVLATQVRATRDVPPFRNSAMDGFAIRYDDVDGQASDVMLDVIATVAAGDAPTFELRPGTAAAIMTGAIVPAGADTVVRVEDTRTVGEQVSIQVLPPRGANVREPGEDMRVGDVVLPAQRLLRAPDIGMIASLGTAVVRVFRRPTVAILATGDELVELGQPLGPGQIANSNAYTLAAAVSEAGALPRLHGIVPDEAAATRAAFADALQADAVISTGGVSMGNFDLVRGVLADLGVDELFWKIAQKPGKPLSFGVRDGVPVFGLPGNPVSALVCFDLYVRPALRAMGGHTTLHYPTVNATLAEPLQTVVGLTEFVRVMLEEERGELRARPTGSQSSGVLRSMTLSDGLWIAPPAGGAHAAGSAGVVLRFDAAAVATAPF